jgi:tripartite-type tricarboxylate transporter receptor subunit TctC
MRSLTLRVACAAVLFATTPAHTQPAYPTKPVRAIVQGATGSGPDVLARVVSEQLGGLWQQPVVVVNQPGGGGVVAARAAAAAEPDGYTLYVPTITSFVIMPQLHPNLEVDLTRDFAYIGLLGETPMMLAVAPALGVGTIEELIALAKRRPGEIFYAANNRGSLPHLTGELFRSRTGIEVNFVPYPGAAAGLQDLMGGRVAMIVESVGALSAAAKAGTIRPLAVASPERLPQLPDLPAMAEAVPGFSAVAWMVLAAPAKTPDALTRKLNQDLNVVLGHADVQRRFRDLGALPRPMSSQATTEFIRAEQHRWRPIVQQAGLKPQQP